MASQALWEVMKFKDAFTIAALVSLELKIKFAFDVFVEVFAICKLCSESLMTLILLPYSY